MLTEKSRDHWSYSQAATCCICKKPFKCSWKNRRPVETLVCSTPCQKIQRRNTQRIRRGQEPIPVAKLLKPAVVKLQPVAVSKPVRGRPKKARPSKLSKPVGTRVSRLAKSKPARGRKGRNWLQK